MIAANMKVHLLDESERAVQGLARLASLLDGVMKSRCVPAITVAFRSLARMADAYSLLADRLDVYLEAEGETATRDVDPESPAETGGRGDSEMRQQQGPKMSKDFACVKIP